MQQPIQKEYKSFCDMDYLSLNFILKTSYCGEGRITSLSVGELRFATVRTLWFSSPPSTFVFQKTFYCGEGGIRTPGTR